MKSCLARKSVSFFALSYFSQKELENHRRRRRQRRRRRRRRRRRQRRRRRGRETEETSRKKQCEALTDKKLSSSSQAVRSFLTHPPFFFPLCALICARTRVAARATREREREREVVMNCEVTMPNYKRAI